MRTTTRLTGAALVAAFLVAACSGGATPSPSPSPSAAASVAASPSPSPSPALACSPADLATFTAGKLTVGTDNPAFPPYFAIRDGGNNPPWEDLGYTGDPTTGEGFESAVAYAVADELGYTKDQVVWVVVPFANATAPGAKTYDFVINQVSWSEERATAIDLSDGYYDLNQAIVALKENPVTAAKSLADLKAFKFGAQVGTTSYSAIQDVIAPTQDAQVYNDNTGAIQALTAKQIDAIVVDLPTADFIANAGVEIDSGLAVIVGQFAATGDVQEHFSLALGRGSALTPCINQALGSLRAAGTLDELATTWLPFQEAVPVLK
jgi:polar amino acid transport system substrate-binding protein